MSARTIRRQTPGTPGRRYGPSCPSCGHTDSGVTDSRPSDELGGQRRRRRCLNCGARFTTAEVTVQDVKGLPSQSVSNLKDVMDTSIDALAASLEELRRARRLLGGKAGQHLEDGYRARRVDQ